MATGLQRTKIEMIGMVECGGTEEATCKRERRKCGIGQKPEGDKLDHDRWVLLKQSWMYHSHNQLLADRQASHFP